MFSIPSVPLISVIPHTGDASTIVFAVSKNHPLAAAQFWIVGTFKELLRQHINRHIGWPQVAVGKSLACQLADS